MSCERSWDFGMTHYRCVSFGQDREFLPLWSRAELLGLPVAATGGVSHSNNSFCSAWPERANLSTCYSSQSVSRRLCCTMRNRRRALRSSHSPLDSNLAVFFNRITRQKHLTHLSRVISLPNHDVCLEYSQTLYEFG